MSTRHALLGLLLERPGYPYDLGDRLRRRLGPAWRINSGQLYQSIERLEQEGWIERIPSSGAAKGRHVFAATPSGRAEFERWFDHPEGPTRPRPALALKLALGGPGRLARTQDQIEVRARDLRVALDELAEDHSGLGAREGAVRADRLLLALNLEAEILRLEAELAWTRRASELILWLGAQDVLWPCAGGRRKGTLAVESSTRG